MFENGTWTYDKFLEMVKACSDDIDGDGKVTRNDVFGLLDGDGKVMHIKDSSFLEEGKGYNKDKVVRFFKCWTPGAVSGS